MKLIQDSQVRLVALICQRQGKTAHGHIGANNITFKKKNTAKKKMLAQHLWCMRKMHIFAGILWFKGFHDYWSFKFHLADNTGQRGRRSVIQTMSELQMCFWFLFKSFRAFFFNLGKRCLIKYQSYSRVSLTLICLKTRTFYSVLHLHLI